MKNPGIKRPFFPLPEDPSETYTCVQLSIPDHDDYRLALLSCLNLLTQWFNWERDTDKRGTYIASLWREVVDNMVWSNACDCGCKGTPDLQRYDENGELEVSYDNGETWESGEDIDPRFTSPLLPPLSGTAEDKRCNTAYGAASFLQSHIYDQITLVSTLAAMIALIGSILAVVITAGTTAPLVTALSGTILAFGTSAVDAALTAGVWDTFSCLIYCRLDDSGTLTAASWRLLLDDIADEFTGVAAEVLRGTVVAFGPVGITNAGRTPRLTGTDCEDCGCGEWVEFFLGEHGQRDVFPTAWPTSNFCTGTYSGGKLVGCCGGNSTGNRIRASLNFDEANITRVIMHTETRAQSSSSDEQLIYNGLVEIITVGTPTGEATTIVDSGEIDIMSGELIFRASAAMGTQTCAGTTSYARIVLIEIHGKGFNPFA